jgi:hypothetical protein
MFKAKIFYTIVLINRVTAGSVARGRGNGQQGPVPSKKIKLY